MTVSQLLRRTDDLRRDRARVEFDLRHDLAADYLAARRRLDELDEQLAAVEADLVEAVG